MTEGERLDYAAAAALTAFMQDPSLLMFMES